MRIVVIDGMGGGMGAQLVQGLVKELSGQAEIWALGTNAIATAAMVKAGASKGATGENAIKVSTQNAHIVMGPLGIIIPNALMGEITPEIAETISMLSCRKILLPVNQPHVELVGFENRPLNELIKEAIGKVKASIV
jgi:S1-C subfamily serine protease